MEWQQPSMLLGGEVQSLHLVPRGVQDLLPQATATGLCPGPTDGAASYAWVLHHQALLVWRVEDGVHASVRRLQLPEPVAGCVFVQILARGNAAPLTVVVCTSSGLLAVWLDAQLLGAPYTQQIAVHAPAASEGGNGSGSTQQDAVSALAACAADSATSGPGFIAVVGAVDGSLHLYHGSARGVFPRQFFRPAGAATGAAADARGGSRRRSAGLLGVLGGVLQSAYNEAFDPLHKVQRRTASALPALGLALLPLGGAAAASGAGGRWRLLVLTQEALDCWLVGASGGRAAGEEHVWSYNLHGVLSSELQATALQVLSFATSTDGAQVFVWSSAQTPTTVSSTLILSQLALKPDMIPYLETSAPVTGVQLPDPEPQERPCRWQLATHAHEAGCIACAPNGAAVAWMPAAGPVQPLVAPGVALAVGCSRVSGLWQVFSAQLGVLEMDTGAGAHEAGSVEGQEVADVDMAGARAPSGRIHALLDTTVNLMALEYNAGAPYSELAHGLGQRLAQLGAFEGDGCADVLLRHSAGILDQMVKTDASGNAPSGTSLREQLAAKQLRHNIFIAALSIGGVLQRLESEPLKVLFEHAQQLQAVMSVLNTQDAAAAFDQETAGAVAAAAGSSGSGDVGSAVGAVRQAVNAAGDETRTQSDQALAAWELFFARPSKTAVWLFIAVAKAAEDVRAQLEAADRSGTSSISAARQLMGLGLLMDGARAAAATKQVQLMQYLASDDQLGEQGLGAWLSSPTARNAWACLCHACLDVKQRLSSNVPWRLQVAQDVHLSATEALLAAFVDAAKNSAETAGADMMDDYRSAREAHVASLVEDVAVNLQELRLRGMVQSQSDPASFSGRVEQLAVQHHCYPQIAAVSDLLMQHGLADASHLHALMRDLPGEPGRSSPPRSLAEHVFEELRKQGKVAELMQLGRVGLEGKLQVYLGAHRPLLWMSQVQAGAFGGAADTLLQVGQEEQGSTQSRRRLLCLAKLAATASAQPQPQRTADTQLMLLHIQEQLGLQQEAAMGAKQLASAALRQAEQQQQQQEQDQEPVLLGLEALSLVPAVREKNKPLWDKLWSAVLDATDLKSLAQLRLQQNQGEAQNYGGDVESSLLCRAMAGCLQTLSQVPALQALEDAQAVMDEVKSWLLQRTEGSSEQSVVSDAAMLANQRLAMLTTAAA